MSGNSDSRTVEGWGEQSTSITQLLLGSMPRTAAAALGDNSQIHREILRASARFIEDVYLTRWTYGHKFRRGD